MSDHGQARTKNVSALLIAALALLMMLYCGSYFALVQPFSRVVSNPLAMDAGTMLAAEHYRIPGPYCAQLYWPLEQIDRRLRPEFWADWSDAGVAE